VGPDDTAGSLYYNTLFELGIATVLESVDLIAAGTAPRLPQDESQASYDPLCRDEHARVGWDRPTAEVYNLIRGCDPQPGAYVIRAADTVRLYDARRASPTTAGPGIVSAIDARAIVVGTRDGSIAIGRLRVGDRKVAAPDAATALGLVVGQPLGDS
jgi:methionyl-tRNA formyltransferase